MKKIRMKTIKNIFLFLIFLFLEMNLNAQDVDYSWGTIGEPFKGKVQKLCITKYKVIMQQDSINKGEMIWKQINRFTENGKETGDTLYRPELTDNFTTYKYDTNGNLTVMTSRRLNNKLICRWEFRYDSLNRQVESGFYKSDNILDIKNIMIYDHYGNMIEKQNHNRDTSQNCKSIYHYNSKGKMIEESTYMKGLVALTIYYKYDINGNLIEDSWYHPGNKLIDRRTYKYDSKNYLIGKDTYDFNDSLVSRQIFTRDTNNNVIEEDSFKKDGNLENKENYIYKYDITGNWTKLTEYKNDVPISIKEQEIKYY